MDRRTFISAVAALPAVGLLDFEEYNPEVEYYWENPPKEYHPEYVRLCREVGATAEEFCRKISLVETYDNKFKRFKDIKKGDTFRLYRSDGSKDDWSVALCDAYTSDLNGRPDKNEKHNYGVEVN